MAIEKLYFTTDTVILGGVTYKRLRTAESGTPGTQSDSIVTIGSKASTKMGIRVWVYHADNTTTEITSGTPVSQVTFTAVEGRVTHSNTNSCPETVLLATDRILVAVFWDVCGAGWTGIPSLSFVTDVLGTTILNAATWTVQYEGSFASIPTYPIGRYLNEITFYFDGTADSYINNFTYGTAPPPPSLKPLISKPLVNPALTNFPLTR